MTAKENRPPIPVAAEQETSVFADSSTPSDVPEDVASRFYALLRKGGAATSTSAISSADNNAVIEFDGIGPFANDIANDFNSLTADDRNEVARFITLLRAGEYARVEQGRPLVAPELYINRRRVPRLESVIEYVPRVYGEWLDGIAFTRADLKFLDVDCHEALTQWESRNGAAPFHLPTERERNDWLIDNVDAIEDPALKRFALRLGAQRESIKRSSSSTKRRQVA